MRDVEDPAVLATPEGSEEYWRRRHEGRPEWAASYWQSQELPERQHILGALSRLAPFGSLLELGCNAGPNLALIRRRWPSVVLGGVDINAEALQYCVESFQREGLYRNLELWKSSLYDLDWLPDRSYDVVLTSGVLIHIPPTRLVEVLAAAWRLARRALVLCELSTFTPEQGVVECRPGKWAYDYAQALGVVFAATGRSGLVRTMRLPPDVGWDTNARDGQRYRSVNAVITVEF